MSESNDLEGQYRALTKAIGHVDIRDRSLIEISGSDRASFLHNMCTNEINKLTVGHGVEAFLTSVQGKTLGHFFAYAQADSILLDTVTGRAEAIIQQLDRYIFREDVQLTDRTTETAKLLVSGANAAEVLGRFAENVPDGILDHVPISIDGQAATLIRTALTQTPAYLVLAPESSGESIQNALAAGGSEQCDRVLYDLLRIESGLPEFGRDVFDSHLPQEVDRNEQAISFVKGCYIGQETIARIDALGHVNHLLVGVVSSSENVDVGTRLNSDGKEVGELTSVAYSPHRKTLIGLARVRRGYHEPGATLSCDHGDVTVQAFPLGS